VIYHGVVQENNESNVMVVVRFRFHLIPRRRRRRRGAAATAKPRTKPQKPWISDQGKWLPPLATNRSLRSELRFLLIASSFARKPSNAILRRPQSSPTTTLVFHPLRTLRQLGEASPWVTNWD